jgi:HEAT repeat protein
LETSAEEQPGEERWTDEEIAEVPEDVRSAFERIEKDEYDQPGVFLVAQMKEAKSPFVRAQAIVLLAKKRPTNLLNIASEGLSDKDSRVREAAAQALATSMHIGAFSGLPIFKTLLLAARDDEDEKVRYWVEKCLARL